MGHKISREQIDPKVKEYILEPVGDIKELDTEDKSNIVNAINELVQIRMENNLTTARLANSIGAPIAAGDSVDEIIGKVDEMIINFKSKVLSLGISVDNTDKFEALINKLSRISEENKSGLQFISGTVNNQIASRFNIDGESYYGIAVNGLKFKPSLIFGYCINDAGNDVYSTTTNIHGFPVSYYFTQNDNEGGRFLNSQSISDDGFNLVFDNEIFQGNFKWFAFGVGEDDKSLEETFKNTLVNKGVKLNGNEGLIELVFRVDELWGLPEREKLANKLTEKGYSTNITTDIDTVVDTIDDMERNSGIHFKYNKRIVYNGITFNPINLSHIMTDDKIYNIKDNSTINIYNHKNGVVTLNKSISKENALFYNLLNVFNGNIFAYDLDDECIIRMNEDTGVILGNYSVSEIKNPIQSSNKLQRILITREKSIEVLDYRLNRVFTLDVDALYCTLFTRNGDLYVYTENNVIDIYDEFGVYKDSFTITEEVQPNFMVIGHKEVISLSRYKHSDDDNTTYNNPYMRIYNGESDSGIDRSNSININYYVSYNDPTIIIPDIDRMRLFAYVKNLRYDYSTQAQYPETYSYIIDYLNGKATYSVVGEADLYNNYNKNICSHAALILGSDGKPIAPDTLFTNN